MRETISDIMLAIALAVGIGACCLHYAGVSDGLVAEYERGLR